MIRVFDAQIHQRADFSPAQPWKIDERWVRIRRPFIVAGGEMTIDSLEMAYSPSRGYYEAPLHIKSNGGTFVIDDLGRQRVEPSALLNRWIIPLEHGFDYFSLHSGHKIKVPFQQNAPGRHEPGSRARHGCCLPQAHGVSRAPGDAGAVALSRDLREIRSPLAQEIPSGLIDRLLERYRSEGRELRGCEPRDLIARVQDICQLLRRPLELNDELLDLAWTSYFGNKRRVED